jgi:hypothetical protein
MDMVRVDGMGGGVKMVIPQQQNIDCDGNLTTTVEVVNMVDCTDMNHTQNSELSWISVIHGVIKLGTETSKSKEDLRICSSTHSKNKQCRMHSHSPTDQKIERNLRR